MRSYGAAPLSTRSRMDNNDNVAGYSVPVDPMELLHCDSCQ